MYVNKSVTGCQPIYLSHLPIYTAIINNDYLSATAIGYVATASLISHLIENHKHGMVGIGLSQKTSYFLNRLDVLGCLLAGIRLLYIYYDKYGFNTTIIMQNKVQLLCYLLPLLPLCISEYDKYNPKLKIMYIITHAIWHISIFLIINSFLKQFIYV